jgi:hypothetical protein
MQDRCKQGSGDADSAAVHNSVDETLQGSFWRVYSCGAAARRVRMRDCCIQRGHEQRDDERSRAS